MDSPIGAQALGHLEAHRSRHQRIVFLKVEIVGIGTVDAADLVDVPETFRDQQSGFCPRPLEQRVDGDRRAVQEQLDLVESRICVMHGGFDAAHQFTVRRQRISE